LSEALKKGGNNKQEGAKDRKGGGELTSTYKGEERTREKAPVERGWGKKKDSQPSTTGVGTWGRNKNCKGYLIEKAITVHTPG